MANNETHKNNRIISFDKLTDELKEQFADVYPQPDGYEPYLKKIIKPDGTPIFVVPFETDDTVYMVKFEVKIDSPMAEDELEKDLFGDSTKGSEMSELDIIEQNESGEKDESHREFTLNHGDYEKAYAEEAAMADASSENAFSDDEEEEEDTDDDLDDDMLDDEDLEPDEDDLLDIELEMMEAEQEEEQTGKKGKKSSSKSTSKAKKTTEKKTAKPKAEPKTSAKTEKTAKPAKETSKKPKKDSKKSK